MKRKLTLAAVMALFLMMTGCNRPEDGITRTEWSHTYESYPVVYVIPDISPKGILTAYEALEAPSDGNAIIRISNTETDTGFAWSDLTSALSEALNEPVVTEVTAKTDFAKCDYTILLSHFRSHSNVGFNGTVKQAALLSATPGELTHLIRGQSEQEVLAEAGKRTTETLKGKILYISVMDRLSIESVGITLPESNSYNIGILASYDPIALDQACVDFVYMVKEGAPFAAYIESKDGIETLIHGEEIGLGSRTYALSTVVDE